MRLRFLLFPTLSTVGLSVSPRSRFSIVMNRSKLLFSVLLRFSVSLVLTSASLASDTPKPTSRIDLQSLVEDALRHNPELRFYEAELTAARGDRKTAGQLANPELSPQVGQKRTIDPAGAVLGEGAAWTVSVSQTFEWPGRLALRKSIANRQVALAENGLAQFRSALAAKARSLGYNLAIAQQIAEATRTVAERFIALQEVAVQRDPAGVTPVLETRILEANSLTYGRRVSESIQEARQAQLELNLLRGQPFSNEVQVAVGGFKFLPSMEVGQLMRLARSNNFELRQRVLELEQQGLKVELAKNERYPAFTLSPYYTQERSLGEDRYLGVGITLPLPLWNRNQGSIEASSARQAQAQTVLQVAERAIDSRIVELVSIYEARVAEMARWRDDSLQRFHEAADLADRHYRLGAVPISTYVEMQKQSLDALEALLKTRREAMDSAQQLELVTGTRLNLFTVNPESTTP